MLVLIIVNLIAVFLAYQSSFKGNNHLFDVSFVFLILVYGIRYQYGNDFIAYENFFHYVNSFDSFLATLDDGHYENGWVILNFLFRPLGFQSLVFCLTIMQFLPIYLLIKRYVPSRWRYLALLFFLFYTDTLINLSMMRQNLAANVILLSLPLFYERKKWWLGLLLVVLAAQFHRSAYAWVVLLPLFELFSHMSKKRMMIFVYVGMMLIVVLFANRINDFIDLVLGTDLLEDYQSRNTLQGVQTLSFGIGFWLNVAMCIIILYELHGTNSQIAFLSVLYCMSYLFTTMAYINASVGRYSLYFSSLFCVILVPLLNKIRNKGIPFMILVLVLLLRFYDYFTFFFSTTWTKTFLHYKTILGTLF